MRAIADRIRILIGDQTVSRALLARRLGVSEFALRQTLDNVSPRSTLDVLAAIVREYGVDPSWLMFGDYDAGSHRVSLEAGSAFSARDLTRLATARLRRDEVLPVMLRLDPFGDDR